MQCQGVMLLLDIELRYSSKIRTTSHLTLVVVLDLLGNDPVDSFEIPQPALSLARVLALAALHAEVPVQVRGEGHRVRDGVAQPAVLALQGQRVVQRLDHRRLQADNLHSLLMFVSFKFQLLFQLSKFYS